MSVDFSFAIFERPLSLPFRYGNLTVNSRRGLLLRMHAESGMACAEASPLPGHSSDSLEEVTQTLEHLGSRDLAAGVEKPDPSLPPSLQFALEAISFQLKNKSDFHPVRSNGLIDWRGAEDASRQLAELKSRGYKIFKLKVRPDNAEEIPDFLSSSSGTFRLDANQSMNEKSLARFFHKIQARGLAPKIDYLEEPLPQWQHPLLRESPVLLAADESIPNLGAAFSFLEQARCPDVFILKPTVLGSLTSLSPLLRQLARAGRRCVVTSSLESEAGRRSIISFLGSAGGNETHGLSTGYLFRENFLADQAVWEAIPRAESDECRFRQNLDWRACP